MKERFKIAGAISLVLQDSDRIFLLKRSHSGYMDNYYGLPMGHIDENESASMAAIREAKEELGIDVKTDGLRYMLTVHRNSIERVYMDVFFEILSYEGEITNNEPHKCEEMGFFAHNSLPHLTTPHVKEAVLCLEKDTSYLETGWK